MHPGYMKMYRNLVDHFWWPSLKKDIKQFVRECQTCQQVKVEHQRPLGEFQILAIPKTKWGNIIMDFLTSLPLTKSRHDTIWVVVDRLTKSAHFIPVNLKDSLDKLAYAYIREIVSLYGVPTSIISY